MTSLVNQEDAVLPRRTAVGVDIGGTKISAGVVDEEGKVQHHDVAPTPATAAATLDVIYALTESMRAHDPPVEAIGVGAAGIVDHRRGQIRWAPNNAYRQLPLRDLLADHSRLPVTVDNDANAAAIAEARYGSGVGTGTNLTLTVGTGVGGGIVVDGRLVRGATGLGGEVGHIVVNPRGDVRCGCGVTGCLEAMASGTALASSGREAARRDPGGTIARLAGGPEQVTGKTVFQAAEGGDARARELFDELGFWLGVGVASLVNVLDPEVVILAGSLPIAAGVFLLRPTEASYRDHAFAVRHRDLPRLVTSRFGVEAGVVGAASLALDAVHGPPVASPG